MADQLGYTSACSSRQRICPEHWSIQPHYHYVDRITGRYDGYFDTHLGRGCTGPCTLAVTETQTWSHKWGVSIGFSKDPVSATVGYDVTHSSTHTFSYSFPVNAGETKVVVQRDWYHVTNMDVRTDWLYYTSVNCSVVSQEFGTAWAGQWFQRIFRAERV